jgi:hypothetical protein
MKKCLHQDFAMFEAETKRLVVRVITAHHDPFDLSGVADIWWRVQRDLGPYSSIVLKKTLAQGGIRVSDPTEGLFHIELVPGDTAGLHGFYHHEARIKDAAGSVATIFTGTLQLRPTLFP